MSESTTIDYLGTDVEEAQEDSEAQHFSVDDPIDIYVGDEVGHDVTVNGVQHFVAISVDGEHRVSPFQAQQSGLSPDDDHVEETTDEDGNDVVEVDVDEASVFISNEDGSIGMGLVTTERGGGVEEAIEEFEAEYL